MVTLGVILGAKLLLILFGGLALKRKSSMLQNGERRLAGKDAEHRCTCDDNFGIL
jgi:hypothetical protein